MLAKDTYNVKIIPAGPQQNVLFAVHWVQVKDTQVVKINPDRGFGTYKTP